MNLTYQEVKAVIESKNFAFFDRGAYNPNLFGIRNRASDKVDEFNDVLGVAYRDTFGNENLLLHPGTTKPGLYWLKAGKMGSDKGTFILMPGQYRGCWMLGEHKGYPALVQKGMGIFKGWRDNDQDGVFDYSGQIFDDVTGLNSHRTGEFSDAEKVGPYSAGCQVRQVKNEHEMMLEVVQCSLGYYPNSFSYTLLEMKDFR